MAVGFKDSMEPGNGYMFHCPVVDRDTRFVVCGFKLRKHRRGEEFADHDCRCAMRGNKCPIVHMMKHEWSTEQRSFFASEPSMHRLPAVIIERIQNILLLPSQARGLNITPEQQEKLFGAVKLQNHAESSPEPTVHTEPTRVKKPRAAAKTSRVEDSMLAGMAQAAPSVAEVLNQTLSGSEGEERSG